MVNYQKERRTMTKRLIVPLVLLLSFLFTASVRSPVQGDEKGKPTVYTYVAQMAIPALNGRCGKFFQLNNAMAGQANC